MPRQARLDVTGALHHIMLRGINKSSIFEDDQDRVQRVGGLSLRNPTPLEKLSGHEARPDLQLLNFRPAITGFSEITGRFASHHTQVIPGERMSEKSIVISLTQPGEGDIVGQLVHALICEVARAGSVLPTLEEFKLVATKLLTEDCRYWAFLARDAGGEPIGVLTLNECAATYARGRFGEIAELYVVPQARSLDVGGTLLGAAIGFGRERGWNHLEVGAPAVPRFQRTISFYLKNEFVEVGPRLRHNLYAK